MSFFLRHRFAIRTWILIFLLSFAVGGFLVANAQGPGNLVVDAPLPPVEAARTMIVPDGFRVSLFAGEPDCQQPIGFCIDDRGRLWVAEAYNYPTHGTKPGDRILIFEDVNGDGSFDKRTVFYDKLNYVTGIEVGFGGAWVMSPPSFYFIPDRDGDDRPDGEPEILLDGFGNHANSHNLANGFAWGPDGWLYGTHGRTNWSLLGKPGTPKSERVVFDGGVYRYHPVRHVWEPYADGTTNPWGIDWNDVGEAFVTNCVNPHLFHVIQGAHYEPWRNRESSKFAYQRIPTIADHLHFIGQADYHEGIGSPEEDAAGGGHAHCGTMIYLGDNWPEKYRNSLFTNNVHGRRINNDILQRHGSGYTASHGKDLMRSRDPWFMGVTLTYGPDGAVYVIDWSDTGECHSIKNTRRETGRIYKIAFGDIKSSPIDLARLSDRKLVQLQTHRNDWYVRHARRLLQERASAGSNMTEVSQDLRTLIDQSTDVPLKLRAIWALQSIGKLNKALLIDLLKQENEYLRAWGIRLLGEDRDLPAAAQSEVLTLAKEGQSALVRLHLASLLQRLPFEQRRPIALALLSRGEDAQDANLPLMIWYGIEPMIAEDQGEFLSAALEATRMSLLARFIGRRVTSTIEPTVRLESLVRKLTALEPDVQAELLSGIMEGLAGRRSVKMPTGWNEAFGVLQKSESPLVLERSLQLALVFDDPRGQAAMRQIATDPTIEASRRNRAVQSLVSKRSENVSSLLIQLVGDPATRRSAIRGLAEFENPDTSKVLLKDYANYDAATRQDALQTLASRLSWAVKLMDAIEANQIPRSDLTAYTARQLYNLGDEKLNGQMKVVWGELRTTPSEKAKLIASFKTRLTTESLQKADRSAGRALFQKTCASCHRFFDAGGKIGPDITGSQRTNLDYLLQTLVDPSAAVAKEYQMQIIETTQGRIVTGFVASESESAVTIQTVNEQVVIPTTEIEQRTTSSASMMPEGMLQTLKIGQVRDLIEYLMGPGQVSLPDQSP